MALICIPPMKALDLKDVIHGGTNIIDEPTVAKLSQNGNYNRTWNHEDLDDYLSNCDESWKDHHNKQLIK